jgi:3-oxoacyl-[acyl-carrier-protein] synthase-3
MTHAAITGWGKCMPPAVLSNADLATFLDTDDTWISTRTGIHERRVAHVSALELAHVASARALACAGLTGAEVELIVYGSCSNDEQIPNTASGLQWLLGAAQAGAMDVNTACTSFLYSLSTATAMIRTGVVRNALVVGVEVIAPFMDWRNRNVAVLFGDGAAAVVLQASDEATGLIGEKLGCYADARQTLRVRGVGFTYGQDNVILGDTQWDFDGQEIFKRAVVGMTEASTAVLAKCGHAVADVDLVVPRQAHRRADGARLPHDPALRQHVGGHGSGGAGRGPREWPGRAGRADPDAGVRRRAHLVLASGEVGRAHHAARGHGRRPAAVRAQRARSRPRVHGARRSAGAVERRAQRAAVSRVGVALIPALSVCRGRGDVTSRRACGAPARSSGCRAR